MKNIKNFIIDLFHFHDWKIVAETEKIELHSIYGWVTIKTEHMKCSKCPKMIQIPSKSICMRAYLKELNVSTDDHIS